MMDGWMDAKTDLPEDNVPVLAVKQLRNGSRVICIAFCKKGYKFYNPDTHDYYIAPYWTCGGNNNILYWMPLPEIPEA